MHLLFLYGPPACGKLTVGKEVARQSGYALFHHHLIVDALLAVFRFASPEFVALRDKYWIETVEAAARSGRSLVFTFCPEPTVAVDFPARLEAAVARCGGTVSFIRLTVSREEQERRLVDPGRTGTKLRRVAVLRAWQEEFASALAAMPDPIMSIDTTVTSAQVAASRIMTLAR